MDLKWRDDDLIMLSALEHYAFCPRQCALIHVEKVFDENIFTVQGSLLHKNVDKTESEVIEGIRTERALPLWSDRLGLVGKADLVEFHDGIPYPVEYKRSAKSGGNKNAADIQLAAQALCLEEMLGVPVPLGAIYHHKSRRRREVTIGNSLRDEVERTVPEIRKMLKSGTVPPPYNDNRCIHCSMRETCVPETVDMKNSRVSSLFKPQLPHVSEEED